MTGFSFTGLLVLILLVRDANDINKRNKNKVIILLLLLAPIVGPPIHFQSSRDSRDKQSLFVNGRSS